MSENLDALTPAEWVLLAVTERASRATGRPVPAGNEWLADGLLQKGYFARHGLKSEQGLYELTDSGRMRLQEAAEELNAHDVIRSATALQPPAQASPGLPEGTHLAWAYLKPTPGTPWVVSEVTVMACSDDSGGGCQWEFNVQEWRDPRGGTNVRVMVGNSAFDAFVQLRGFFEWLAGRQPTALRDVLDFLTGLGAEQRPGWTP